MPFEPTHSAARTAAKVVRLSLEDRRALAEAILNPPPPNAALKRAAETYRTLIQAAS